MIQVFGIAEENEAPGKQERRPSPTRLPGLEKENK
jgi:hypothetical protein